MMRNGLFLLLAILATTLDSAVSENCDDALDCKKCLNKDNSCAWYLAGTGPDFIGCLPVKECTTDPKWEGGTCVVEDTKDKLSNKQVCKKALKPKKDKCGKNKDCTKCVAANIKKGQDCSWYVVGDSGGECIEAKKCRTLKVPGTCYGAEISEKFGKYCKKIKKGDDVKVKPPKEGWPHLVGKSTDNALYYFDTYWPDLKVSVLGPDSFYLTDFNKNRVRVFVDALNTTVIDDPIPPKIG